MTGVTDVTGTCLGTPRVWCGVPYVVGTVTPSGHTTMGTITGHTQAAAKRRSLTPRNTRACASLAGGLRSWRRQLVTTEAEEISALASSSTTPPKQTGSHSRLLTVVQSLIRAPFAVIGHQHTDFEHHHDGSARSAMVRGAQTAALSIGGAR